MKTFNYVINDDIGIHARPAGLLAELCKGFKSKTTITRLGKTAEFSKLMMVMSLGIKCGDEVEIQAEGEDEETAIAELEKFFHDNL